MIRDYLGLNLGTHFTWNFQRPLLAKLQVGFKDILEVQSGTDLLYQHVVVMPSFVGLGLRSRWGRKVTFFGNFTVRHRYSWTIKLDTSDNTVVTKSSTDPPAEPPANLKGAGGEDESVAWPVGAASQLVTWPTRHMWWVDLLILHSTWRVDHTGVTSWLLVGRVVGSS